MGRPSPWRRTPSPPPSCGPQGTARLLGTPPLAPQAEQGHQQG